MKVRMMGWTLMALLGIGAFVGMTILLNSPTYALFQLGRAIHHRDAGLFLTYIDLEQVLAGQGDTVVDVMIDGKDREDTRRVVKGLMRALAPQINQELRRKVAEWITDPNRDNLASSFDLVLAADITRRDEYALVVLANPANRERLRLGMRRMQGHPWRVVHINPRDLASLLRRHLKGSATRQPMPAAPAAPPTTVAVPTTIMAPPATVAPAQ